MDRPKLIDALHDKAPPLHEVEKAERDEEKAFDKGGLTKQEIKDCDMESDELDMLDLGDFEEEDDPVDEDGLDLFNPITIPKDRIQHLEDEDDDDD